MKTFLPFLLAFFFLMPYSSVSICQQVNTRDNQSSKKMALDFKKGSPADEELCVPEYNNGCGAGDGFTDFAVAEIENYGSGCANLNGNGWSQYLELGPAVLFPGISHDFIMQTGYDNQFVTIWVDFDDDEIFESDEIILFDFSMENAGQFYTAAVTIPPDATLGLHYMRARTNWQGSCDDPCEAYAYGEAEDYYVFIGAAETGAIEGYVTELATGNPVEGATISLEGLITFSTTSASDGYYFIDYIFIGEYDLECSNPGYNSQNEVVVIEEDITLEMNFELTAPIIQVSPLEFTINLPLNGSAQEPVSVENVGNGSLDWSASIQLAGEKNKGFLDLQYQYPVAQGGGEAGIESDGNFIYTTKWNTGDILKYNLDGTFIGTLSISSPARDLAYNGTYFYGSAATTLIEEMDFDNEVVISTFSAPASVRALAYNENEDVFYANNYSSDIMIFDLSGANLGSFPVGPIGENYYGFAYDQASPGGPFLWGYAQTGESQNQIVQIQLPSGIETGFSFDVVDKLSGPVFNMAGGLFTHPNMVFGKWTLGGLVQNEWIWGLELTDAQTWLWIGPNTGTLGPNETENLMLEVDASDLEPGQYNANILFSTYPEVGNPLIEVTLNVDESSSWPCNLLANISCTNVELSWEVCPAGSPEADSFYIYRDGEIFFKTVEASFTDSFVDPEMPFTYSVTAFFNGIETIASDATEVTVPLPENLEPENLMATVGSGAITLSFDPPAACLAPDLYNIYRDGELLASITGTEFQVGMGNYTYTVTAVYYFGESMPSNPVVITGIAKQRLQKISVYPNPATHKIWVETASPIHSVFLYDNLGLGVYESKPGTKKTGIELSGFNRGLYFLRIKTSEGEALEKFVIQ